MAALGAAGGLMVTLPLVQVLRFQSAEIEMLKAARAGLDPVSRTVEVQRGVLAHRDVAARVLAGRAALEPERLLRQAEVDDRLGALAVALAAGHWHRAVIESDALRDDWSQLARRLLARRVGLVENEQAHRLLIEQALQIIDLVSDVNGAAGGGAAQPALLNVARTAPRLAWQLAALTWPQQPGNDDAVQQQRERAAVEAAVARLLGQLNHALLAAPRADVASAGAAAGAAADHLLHLLRDGSARPADLQHAAATAWEAQLTLHQRAGAAAAQQLDAQARQATLRRDRGLAAMATLAVLALLLAATLRRGRRQVPAGDGPQASPPVAGMSPQEQQAGWLFERLRDGRGGRGRGSRRHHGEHEPTLPGGP